VLRRAEELAQLSDQLHRSNQELEAFSYSVSHDLRAPFRHIVGYSELLKERETNLSPESVRYISNIVDSAKFAGELVDHLLRFSRIGKVSLSMMRLSLSKLVEEVQRSLASDLKDRKIEWRVGQLPEVIADPIFLRLICCPTASSTRKPVKLASLKSAARRRRKKS
jgi:chemotaxis family two-component system sensor kinase Cph1